MEVYEKILEKICENRGTLITPKSECINTKCKLLIKCQNGHIFDTSWNNLKNRFFCRRCWDFEKYSTLKRILNAKYYTLHTPFSEYKNYKTKCLIKCNYGHMYYSSLQYQLQKRMKCKQCLENYYKQRQCFQFSYLARVRGGNIIDKTFSSYINKYSKIEVICINKHKFKTSLGLVRGKISSWCPQCKIGFHELYSKYILEHFTGKEFVKIRPKWLKSSNGGQMEIDLYNDKLKLAVEYNGMQHYKFIKFFHKTKEDFNNSIKRDEEKYRLINKQKIKLLIIPYTEKVNIQNFIKKKLMEFNISFVRTNKFDKIKVYNELRKNNSKKLCSGCNLYKPFDQYYKRFSRPIGVISKCKTCTKKLKRTEINNKK